MKKLILVVAVMTSASSVFASAKMTTAPTPAQKVIANEPMVTLECGKKVPYSMFKNTVPASAKVAATSGTLTGAKVK